MGPVKDITMNKRIFVCRHNKHLFHVLYSGVKPARDCDNVGDEIIENWRKNGECDQKVESDRSRELKITEDKMICEKCFEEYVDRKKGNQSAKQTAANWGDDEQMSSTRKKRSSFSCKVKENKNKFQGRNSWLNLTKKNKLR